MFATSLWQKLNRNIIKKDQVKWRNQDFPDEKYDREVGAPSLDPPMQLPEQWWIQDFREEAHTTLMVTLCKSEPSPEYHFGQTPTQINPPFQGMLQGFIEFYRICLGFSGKSPKIP